MVSLLTKMKTLFSITVIFFILALSGEINAREGYPYVSGNDLIDNCENIEGNDFESAFNMGHCYGYILGVYDTIEIEIDQKLLPSGKHSISGYYCLTTRLPYKQIVRVVVKYLQDNPKDLHTSAAILIDLALREAFGPNPC